MSFYKRFHQQEPISNNLFFKNYLNNSPKSLDRREIFSRDEPARGYPRVIPSRQVFDRSDLFVRNSRNKYSESSSEDKRMKNYKKIEEDPMSKVLVYADRDTKSLWKNSRDTSSSNVMQSEKSFPKIEDIYRQEDILDEEKNAVKKYSNSSSQLRYSREKYNSIGVDPLEIKHDSYVKDTDIPKSTKEFFDKWDIAEDSSQSSNLGQFRNNVPDIYPAEKQEIIAKDDNKQINSNSYNSEFPQDLNVWESRKNEELFDSLMRANTKPFKKEEDDEDMKEYFEDEPEYFIDDKDMKEYFEDETEYFMDDKDMKEFEDETKQDTVETERNSYNPRVFSQNNWKGIENKEFLDDLDFMRENSQETEQLGLYSEENNKNFQDEQNENIIFRDKAYPNAETARAPIINAYNAYIVPRYLNIINDKKNQPFKSETQKLSEAKNSIRANPVKEMDHKFFEDEAVTGDNIRIQDFVLPKDMEEYSDSVVDKRNNIRNKNEALTELDPDLLDDIENPTIETTESTLT